MLTSDLDFSILDPGSERQLNRNIELTNNLSIFIPKIVTELSEI
jgi:hypothetical protein